MILSKISSFTKKHSKQDQVTKDSRRSTQIISFTTLFYLHERSTKSKIDQDRIGLTMPEYVKVLHFFSFSLPFFCHRMLNACNSTCIDLSLMAETCTIDKEHPVIRCPIDIADRRKRYPH